MAFSVRWYNIIILSLAFMLLFTAFQTGMSIQVTVLNSVKMEDPSFKADGYITSAIIYLVFALSNWVAPSFIGWLGPRPVMLIGASIYVSYIVAFIWPMTWLLYLIAVLLGWAAAILWTAQGHYMSINAGPDNMAKHSGVFWAILQTSMLWGNIFVTLTFASKKTIDSSTRMLTYTVLAIFGGCGVVMFIFLKRAAPNDSGEQPNEKANPPGKAFVKALKLMATADMALYAVCFFYTGIELSFFSGVYSTSVGDTLLLPDSKRLVGFVGICVGVGEVTGGLVFGVLSKYTVRWGRGWVVLLGYLIHLATFSLVFINLPDKSPLGNTEDTAIIAPNVALALSCALLLGLADAIYNTQCFSALGIVYAHDTASAFAIFKFSQSAAAAAAFFFSPYLTLYWWMLLLLITSTLGTVCYMIAELLVKKRPPGPAAEQ